MAMLLALPVLPLLLLLAGPRHATAAGIPFEFAGRGTAAAVQAMVRANVFAHGHA